MTATMTTVDVCVCVSMYLCIGSHVCVSVLSFADVAETKEREEREGVRETTSVLCACAAVRQRARQGTAKRRQG